MSKTDNLGDFLTDVANAIRSKKNTTGPINAQNFASEISSIETGTSVSEHNMTFDSGASTYIRSGTMKFTKIGKYVLVRASLNFSSKISNVVNNNGMFTLGSIPTEYLPKFEGNNTTQIYEYPCWIYAGSNELPFFFDLIFRNYGDIDMRYPYGMVLNETNAEIEGGYEPVCFWYETE